MGVAEKFSGPYRSWNISCKVSDEIAGTLSNKYCVAFGDAKKEKHGFWLILGGLILLKGDKWAHDKRLTIKSCAGVIFIGMLVAGAMLIIRLAGEQRVQKFLDVIFQFKRKEKAEKLTTERCVPDNQS